MRKGVSLVLLGLLASGCFSFIARERHLQVEGIDGRLFFRFGGFRGTAAGIDPRWEREKTKLREAINRYLKDNPQVDSDIKKHLQNLEIAVGMTMDQIKLLWGQPHHSIVWGTEGPGENKRERWFYDRIPMALFKRKTWYYELGFDQGRLSEIIQWDTGQPL